ncbi:MAG: CapA family protein [Erysipelotrichaceae bacterium]|nr:CapA family protein [Erysipelotrichaceae bacterium]
MSNISFVFTGDIGFDRYMEGQWDDEELLSQEVLDFLHSGDHVVANVEGAMVPLESNTSMDGVAQLVHTMNPEAKKALSKMKADIWNLCNNHIMDAGAYGVECTLKEAEAFGAKTIGVGMNLEQARRPLYFEEAGGIGMFSVGFRRGCKPADVDKAGCYMWNEVEMIRETIKEIKAKCRWCVLVAHAGEEFTSLPSPYTRDKYLEFLEMGADVIVAHHPHVPMNYEKVGEKYIFYSLGNFIFDTPYQRAQFNTEKGILVKLNFSEDSYSFEAMGLAIDREKEHVIKAELPDIFVDVAEEEFNLLTPLAAKMLVSAYKRQQVYLNPDKFKNASEEEWKEHFANPKRSGRVPGEALDFLIICPLAEKEVDKEWEKSTLEGVKKYILDQI